MSLVNFLKFDTLKRQRQVSELSEPFEKKEKRMQRPVGRVETTVCLRCFMSVSDSLLS
jgi:hypothetical protein